MDKNISQIDIEIASQKNRIFSIIESLLFVSGEPLKIKNIASILECSKNEVEELMEEMMKNYGHITRGIKLIKIEDSYQLVTKQDNSSYVQKLLNVNVRQSLSQAALETLAIIAYKQPITRIEIEEIRGVKCDKAVVNLMEKELVKECGRKEVAGRPILYGTSEKFLKHFNLECIANLPDLDDFSFNIQEGIENVEKLKEIHEEEKD